MKQTLAEKLRILADAADAGEEWVFVEGVGRCAHYHVLNYIREYGNISHIPPKPATIKMGNMEINAPLRVMPKDGVEYWIAMTAGDAYKATWQFDENDHRYFDNANCWATKSDAESYRDASLAVRKGEV